MASDVCKHCTHAGCLDVCPTGALFRTEFGTVVVQQDICNGCGYCVSGCPYGVIDRREDDGRAWKCTLCYDRLHDGLEPACAKACPTDSIQFGDARRAARAGRRSGSTQLHERGVTEARLYGHDPNDGVGGDGAFFLLLDEPEVYGLPPDPVVPTRDAAARCGARAAAAAGAFAVAGIGAFAVERAGWRDDRGAPMHRRHGHRNGRAVAPAERGDARGARRGDAAAVPGHPGRATARRAGRRAAAARGRRNGRGGEPTVVPEAEFRSYYGRPVLKPPVWKHEIAGVPVHRRPGRRHRAARGGRGPHRPPGAAPRRAGSARSAALVASM